MSSTDEQKFNAVMASINQALGTDGLGLTDNGESKLNYSEGAKNLMEELSNQKEAQLDEELKEVQEFLESNQLEGENLSEFISASKSEEGIVLTIKDLVLFSSGKAEVKSSAKDLLDKLAPLIENKGSNVRVEGHTDNVQVGAESEYKDNWELSTARAANVVDFILQQKMIDASKISIAGYAEHKPVAKNDTDANKAKNRRVDIILISNFKEAEKKAEEAIEKKEQAEKKAENTKDDKKEEKKNN